MKLFIKKTATFFTICSSLLLTTCAAYDLGKDGTTYYEFKNPEIAAWKSQNGEDQLSIVVKNKCATCHTDEKPWYKPENTPEKANSENADFGLNKIGLEAFWDAKNNELVNVKKCLTGVCGLEEIPMPPKYATPLSDNEKAALLSFTQRLLDEQAKNNPSALSTEYNENCSGCHGLKGEGVGNFPKIAGTTLSLDDFKDIIQNGRGEMPKQSDYDLNQAEADLAELQKL